MEPGWPQMEPRWSKMKPRWPKMEPGWPKMWARRAQKKADSRTKRSLYTLTPDHPALLVVVVYDILDVISYMLYILRELA